MSWITFDHECAQCGHVQITMHARNDVRDVVSCEDCGGDSHRKITANITQASYVDGSGRLDHIREQRKIEREFKVAKRQGRRDDAVKLRTELAKQKSTIK